MNIAAYVTRSAGVPPGRLFDLHAQWPHRYPALFESAARGGPLGRYDLLFAHPLGCIARFSDGTLTTAGSGARLGLAPDAPFLDSLERFIAVDRSPAVESELPFTGGWVVFAAYEIAAEIEPRLRLPRAAQPELEGLALRIPAALIYEHGAGRLHLLAEAGQEHLLDRIAMDLEACPPRDTAPVMGPLEVREDPPQHFIDAVRRAQDYIAAGDVYQVNLSRGWYANARREPAGPPSMRSHRAPLERRNAITPSDLYASLRSANPAPFAASLVLGDHAILSSSPERLCHMRGGEITTRPIAGTRPRTRREGADEAEKSVLAAHPKERAEHVMLIDLERNDLGRLCRPGSVRVDEFMAVESYEHVHHIVSNVRGELREGVSLPAILRAVFPGGTITGCPKIRCMQIIAELEGIARGAYTGTMGYLNRDGSGDFNILIRTMTCSPQGIVFRAGAGIVADSIAQRELEETRAKARGLLRALGQDA